MFGIRVENGDSDTPNLPAFMKANRDGWQTWKGREGLFPSHSYAVRSVPGAGLAILGPVHVSGQAVVGRRVRGAL